MMMDGGVGGGRGGRGRGPIQCQSKDGQRDRGNISAWIIACAIFVHECIAMQKSVDTGMHRKELSSK